MPRDADDGQIAVEVHDLAFEVVACSIDDGEMLPRLQTQHARMLGVLAGKAQRERRAVLVGEHLVVKEELME